MGAETIVAIATPIGKGGIGIVKISGQDAIPIAQRLFRPAESGAPQSPFRSHMLHYGHLVDPDSGNRLDEILLAVMRAPHSYTCEDVVEINAHSGLATLNEILMLVLRQGARLAEPGEFTKRAFLNGRIDLTQAEAVIDIIESRSRQALKMAVSQIDGGLRQRVDNIRDVLLQRLVEVETGIDFIEDIDETLDTGGEIETALRNDVLAPLNGLGEQYERAHVYRDGLRLVVVGRPNVGKSSLMNSLIRRERSIVTEIPGTTRDLIEESVTIHGIPLVLTDTAGLREACDIIEEIGIRRTRECIAAADLILFLIEAHKPLVAEDMAIYDAICGKPLILVLNKDDLVSSADSLLLPPDWQHLETVRVSSLEGSGINQLERAVADMVLGTAETGAPDDIVPSLRHMVAIEQASRAVENALGNLADNPAPEILTIDLREAIDCLGQIIGETTREQVLDEIFERFCIGK